MEYSKIIAITGLPGLFELVSSKSDGGIVRSLDDKSTRFVSSRVHQFSHLESIEVYTTRHNVNLVDVLKAMESSKEKVPDEKDGTGLKSYFEKVYPELDFDRVYTSDLKKMVKWFSVLAKNAVEIKLSEPTVEEPAVEPVAEPKEEKPSKKQSSVKLELKTETTQVDEKKPAKKPGTKEAEAKSVKKTTEKKQTADQKSVKKAGPKKGEPVAAKDVKKPAPKPAEKKQSAKKK